MEGLLPQVDAARQRGVAARDLSTAKSPTTSSATGFTNVNQQGLDEMSDAIAHTVLVYSRRDFVTSPLLDPVDPVTATLSGGEGGGLHEDDEEAR